MKNRSKNLSIYIVLIIAAVFIVVYLVAKSANFSQPTPTNIQSSSQLYSSKNLKFTISVPSGFQVEEKFTTVSLRKTEEEIIIDRIGTNFDNLEGYLQDLATKNKLLLVDKKSYVIDHLDSISALIRHTVSKTEDEKSYFIYASNWVYSLSTSSEALFDDLDTVAQSFRYTQ